MSDDVETSSPLIHQITELVEPIVLEKGLELVELQFLREGHGWVLRLIIDRDGGVTIDDCATVSREVGHMLEVEDPIEQAFHLEVSSPGLDRPLKRERDYLRCRGKKAKLTLREAIEGAYQFVGVIEDLVDGTVVLETEQGKMQIDLCQVKKARLVIEI